MAISIESQRNDYIGDGSVTIIPYTFKVLTAADLNVIVTDTDDGETTLTYPSDYTVSGVGSATGGDVVLASALTLGYQITVRRIRQLQQTTSIRNETEYYQATIEDALDKLCMLDQQQQEQIDRSVHAFVAENVNFDLTLPPLQGEQERVIGTNALGTGLELGPTFSEITDAAASAVAAAASAAAAAASASSADVDSTAAASSAISAAAAAAAALAAGFDSNHSPHAVTDGQAAANLTGETFDSAVYSSVYVLFEIKRGSGPYSISLGWFQLSFNGTTWDLFEGPYGGPIHGVTWSLTGTTTAQLKAALDSGAGNGSIKFKKTSFAV